jgi:hypothetical protein
MKGNFRQVPIQRLEGISIPLALFLFYGSDLHGPYQVLMTTKPSGHRSLVKRMKIFNIHPKNCY